MKKIFQFEPDLGKEEKEELVSVIDSGWYTEASKTKEFERMFASYVGRKYAVATTSGTAALCIAAQGLGLENNDEVIVPDFTFVASPNSIILAGSKVELVDINKKNLCLDLEKTKKLVSKKTKAIMPVDFNGRAPDLVELKEFAESSNIAIIEDSCHGIGSFHAGKHTGCYSDVGIFSFSTPKIITTGQGGMLVTDDKELYEKFKMIKDFGRDIDKKHQMENAFEHTEMGYNFKFTEFQAAVGIAQMRKLKKRMILKRKMFRSYRELLSKVSCVNFIETDLDKITPWMVDILVDSKRKRDSIIKHLEKNSIESRIFYPPIHRLSPYQNKDVKFKITSEISDKGLWLPSSVNLKENQINFICNHIKNFFK